MSSLLAAPGPSVPAAAAAAAGAAAQSQALGSGSARSEVMGPSAGIHMLKLEVDSRPNVAVAGHSNVAPGHVNVASTASAQAQWTPQEIKDLITIRAVLEPDFSHTKRNKPLWDVVSCRMKDEKGHVKTAEQCKLKWKNLCNRYSKVNQSFLFYFIFYFFVCVCVCVCVLWVSLFFFNYPTKFCGCAKF